MRQSSMKVDLSNFFKDERRNSLVFIDAAWNNIKDLQDHIQNLFSLKDISLLTADGCFLPPRESIKVLNSAEGLKAFRFASHDSDTFVSPAPVKSSKKRKNRSVEEQVHLTASTPLRPSKRSKNQNNSEWINIEEDPSCVRKKEVLDKAPGPSVQSKLFINKGTPKAPETQTEVSSMSTNIETENKESAPQIKKKSKNKKPPKSPEASEQVQNEPAPKSVSRCTLKESKMSESKNQDILSEKSGVVALQEDETPEEQQDKTHLAVDQTEKGPGIAGSLPSISFRSPLLEMSFNVPRIIPFPTKKKQIEILEYIQLKPISPRLFLQKGVKSDTAKQFPSNGKDSTLKLESIATLHDEESPDVKDKKTVSEDIKTAVATFSENIIETSTTLPEAMAAVESAYLDNSTEAETTIPSEAEATNPLELTDSFLQNNTSMEKTPKVEKILPDDENASPIKNNVDSKDVKTEKVPIFEEQLVSDSDDDVMLVDDSNIDVTCDDSEPIPVVQDRQSLGIIRNLLRTATPLTSLPSRGDTVIFKLLKIKGNAKSGSTEFIAGRCTYVNRRTKIVTVETITYPPEIGRILSQYYMSGLDESSEDVRTLSIHLKDMIEAKSIIPTID
ncbi:coilin isoform X1 [Drosophila mauritiana]|uniref:Coilin isoform X1 n=1 Tax=Drosophila mauritiana TaxID=7226 RepID=A0A6P8JHC7_DROMA|nr:coilin isoform X1 [Drosophila mauritiana]